MTDYIVPCLIFFILAHGVATGTNVYSALMRAPSRGFWWCAISFRQCSSC